MIQKTWELKNTKQTTKHICPNCQENIIHHSHYNDERFCEDCRTFITNSYNNKEDMEDKNSYINVEDFLQSVYDELSYVYRGIDERY